MRERKKIPSMTIGRLRFDRELSLWSIAQIILERNTFSKIHIGHFEFSRDVGLVLIHVLSYCRWQMSKQGG